MRFEVAVPEVRNKRFETGAEVPRYWHGGRRSVTLFFDNLSIFFPAGEMFFVASVKRYKKRLTGERGPADERLLAEVAAFCAQEGHHRREHARYNEMLEAQGFPARAMEERVEALLARVTARTPKRWQLAVTCALEHLTATLAHLVLSEPRVFAGADPVMAELWRWHAAEENEHKAVAFDVFRKVGGTERERMALMAVASLVFWAKVAEHQVRLMHADGILWSAREWAALIRFLFVEPGGIAALGPLYLDYYRPGFHPWDLDNRDLLERWKGTAAVSARPSPGSSSPSPSA